MKKKFKVRVRQYKDALYVVEVADYYWIPVYTPLLRWDSNTFFVMDKGDVPFGWRTKLFHVKEAEEVVKSLKSMKDVYDYMKEDRTKQLIFLEAECKKKQENTPYKIKQIL